MNPIVRDANRSTNATSPEYVAGGRRYTEFQPIIMRTTTANLQRTATRPLPEPNKLLILD